MLWIKHIAMLNDDRETRKSEQAGKVTLLVRTKILGLKYIIFIVDENVCDAFIQVLTNAMCAPLQKLVVKPDQLIKRRGKLGLIKVGTDLAGVKTWVDERMNKDQQVSRHASPYNDCRCTVPLHAF